MTWPPVDPPMDPPDPEVAAILERAAWLTPAEAASLDAALRGDPPTIDAWSVVEEHQSWLNDWGMFDNVPHPSVEMRWARERVDAALGLPARAHSGLDPDDGTVAWGAGTAVALAVLASGRARFSIARDLSPLRAAWDKVMARTAETDLPR